MTKKERDRLRKLAWDDESDNGDRAWKAVSKMSKDEIADFMVAEVQEKGWYDYYEAGAKSFGHAGFRDSILKGSKGAAVELILNELFDPLAEGGP